MQVTIPDGASAVLVEVEPIADGLNDPPFTTVTATLEAQAGITVTGGPASANITEPTTLGSITVSGSGGSVTATSTTPVNLYVPEPATGSAKITISGPPASSHILWSVAGSNNSSAGMQTDFGSGNPTIALSAAGGNQLFTVTVGVDKNGNGALDASEVQRTINVSLLGAPDLEVDSNNDGQITAADNSNKDARGASGVPAGGERADRRGIPGTSIAPVVAAQRGGGQQPGPGRSRAGVDDR